MYSKEFETLPQELSLAFDNAKDVAAKVLTEDEFSNWAESGLLLTKKVGRNCESSVEYFRASLDLLNKLPFVHLKQWGFWSNSIAEESDGAATAYLKASRLVSNYIKPWDIPEWAQLGKKILAKDTRSSKLAKTYFENSPEILRVLSFSEFKHITVLVETISDRSVDEASKFLTTASYVLPNLGEDTRPCLSLISNLVRNHWEQATKCLEIMATVLSRVDNAERARFLTLSARVSEISDSNIVSFLQESSISLGATDGYLHVHILNMADKLSKINTSVVLNYLNGVPKALQRVSINQLETWYEAGLSLLHNNEDAGIAFFKGESLSSEEMLEKLSSGVELTRVKEIMRLYCRALSAIDVEITTHESEDSHGKSWVPMEQMLSDGANVYLPVVSERFDNKDLVESKLRFSE